jgi:hypothetical protein
MPTRQYSSRSQQTTLTSAITAGTTSITVVSGTALLGGVTIPAGRTFTLVIDPDTALEEIVDATAVSTNTFTITRAIDGSSAQEHSAGAVVRHMAIGRDYRDANLHTQASASYNDGAGNAQSMHGIASGEGSVVGTDKAQTLTNKIITAPTISNPTLTGTASAGAVIVFEGTTVDAYDTTLTVVDPTQNNTVTIPNTTGIVVVDTFAQTLTNKILTSPTISGSPTITGLSSAGMVSSSATPKDYVDAILGSATAAATSAASAAASAVAAATSATSASNSASAASSSADAAATSATSASTSASSASTQAVNASNYAAAASTSATSASNSASAATTSATSASNSASAASTSATSAAASASAASTSASSAATSASSAVTSANSAATSANSAAASYDSFDDRYLGAKASDPTVDNDGNPLITGALYFNTAIPAMKVYTGSAWQIVAADTSNFVDKSLWTGKGALVGATAAGTPATLTVASTNGYVLSVDSTESTGLKWILPNPGDITGVTAGTGLSGGGTSGTVTLDLANTAVTAGAYTYTSLTVDAQGRITAASSGTTPVTSVTSGATTRITVGGTSTAPTVDLSTSGVTAATYTLSTITVDAYGRITSASTGVAAGETFNPLLLMGA